MTAWVYLLTNRPRGILYVGMTDNLSARMGTHRLGLGSLFVRQYNLHRLVLTEHFATAPAAIAREKQLKMWRRDWKIALIEATNPTWEDLTAYLADAVLE